MAQCPVQDCERPVGFGSKALAEDAAVLAAYFPVFDRAEELWPDEFPDEFFEFVNLGRGYSHLVHERVHGNHVQVPIKQIKDWRHAAVEASEGVAIRDPEWFSTYWTDVGSRGLQVPESIHRIIRGGQDIPAWRGEGKHLESLLTDYADCVRDFNAATDPSSDEPVRSNAPSIFKTLMPAHDQFISALNLWIKNNAPGARNVGRKDPTGGGFGALSRSLQDAYKAVCLGHLSLLGLTIYAAQVESDNRVDEIEEAYGLAAGWYNDAMSTVRSIVTTGEPVGTKFLTGYVDQRQKHELAENVYKRLQPYLDGLAPKVSRT